MTENVWRSKKFSNNTHKKILYVHFNICAGFKEFFKLFIKPHKHSRDSKVIFQFLNFIPSKSTKWAHSELE